MYYAPMAAFILLGVIWGSNFIYMKMAAELITPLQVVFLRVLFGAVPVLLFALVTNAVKLSHLRYARHFIVMSVLATVAYYYGFAKGASLLPSGVAGVLSGTIPVFALLLALVFIADEKFTLTRALGISLGFIGVVLIANPSSGGLATSNVAGVFYMVLGSLSIGASFIYAQRYIVPLRLPPVALTTYQLAFGLLLLAVITDFNDITLIAHDTHTALGMIVGLGILGTGMAYLIYYYLIDQLGAVAASSVTYLPPLVALAIGALLVGEDIGLTEYAASAIILLSVALVNKTSRAERQAVVADT